MQPEEANRPVRPAGWGVANPQPQYHPVAGMSDQETSLLVGRDGHGSPTGDALVFAGKYKPIRGGLEHHRCAGGVLAGKVVLPSGL